MNRLVRVGGFAAFLLSLGATGWWWTGTASLLRPAHVWPAARFLQVVQLAGVVVGVLSVRRISVSELGGLTDAVPDAPLEAGGPYALVRHPVYVSLVLLLGGTTTMTGDRLLFASLALLYIVVAIPFEEAGLARAFGPQYDAYRHRVRWRLIPYIY